MFERMALNLIGRLSGIATLTRQYVDAIAGTKAVICDTRRKTTPGLRNLEKYAVRCGGGTLHRIGLFDAVLYKDNHLAGIPLNELAARLTSRESVRWASRIRFVEVEVDSLEQMHKLLRMPPELVNIILLDNMAAEVLSQAVQLRNAHRTDAVAGGVGQRKSGNGAHNCRIRRRSNLCRGIDTFGSMPRRRIGHPMTVERPRH